ncbi:phosphatase PAP2 family protein [Rhodococcus sp. SMB37]|uniref:phosphatase PAP2 family protein n=1 Tax=Rhodococcus sp. SMB37 TaxID=2512213 RepID=UPI001F545DE6|nr:phosphatase PAP2 family protein [Rhodococcus sp. SMB37]
MVVTERSPRIPPRLVQSMLLPAMPTAVVLALLAVAAVPVRDELYLAVAQTFEASFLGPAAGVVADKGLLVLVATAGALAVWSWREDRRAFRTLVVAGAGVVAAYLLSEFIKLVVTEPRPCRTLGIATVLECPEIGDWSWPSNHSVIAASFATACVLAVRRSLWLVAPLAMVLGLSRVTVGVHYVHDVFSGMALGVLVVSLVTAALLPVAARIGRPSGSEPVRPSSRPGELGGG